MRSPLEADWAGGQPDLSGFASQPGNSFPGVDQRGHVLAGIYTLGDQRGYVLAWIDTLGGQRGYVLVGKYAFGDQRDHVLAGEDRSEHIQTRLPNAKAKVA